MNGDGWSRLDPTYVTWFDYRLSLLLWGARNKGCRTTACIGVYRNMARPQSKEKKKMEGNKDDNLGRDEKKRVAKKNMNVKNRCKRCVVKKIHERIRINARMLFVQNGHMSR
jgi:hypothetical protein